MTVSSERTLRPVALVAYGESGLAWLERVAASCRSVAFVDRLVHLGLIQFWPVMSGDHSTHERWPVLHPALPVDVLRALLERARRDDLRTQIPGLEVQEILILERLSLYDSPAALRQWLFGALEATRNVAPHGEGEVHAFGVDWVTLADGTWWHGKPDQSQQAAARKLCAILNPRRMLFVDSHSAVGGVVSPEVADNVVGRLAVAMASSDLAFPRREFGNEGMCQTLSMTPSPSTVTPISVMTLLHGREDIASLQVESILRRLLGGAHQPLVCDMLENRYAKAASLTEALQEEVEQRRFGGTRIRTKDRRRQALSGLYATALFELSTTGGESELKRMRERISHYRGSDALRLSGSVSAVPEPAPAFWLARLIRWILTLLGVSASAHPTDVVRAESNEGGGHSSEMENVLRVWEHAAEKIEQTLDALRKSVYEWTNSRTRASDVAWTAQEVPYHWRICALPEGVSTQELVSADLIGGLADALADESLSFEPMRSPEALKEGIRRYVDSASEESESAFRATQLSAALRDPYVQPVRLATRESSLLVSAGGHESVQEVVWLTNTPGEHERHLKALELPARQNAMRALLTEDADRTTRIAFGAALPWEQVPSLRFLSKASS